MARASFVCTLWIGILFTAHNGIAGDYALILGGVGGQKSFYDEYWRATSRMHNLLTDEYGYSPENISFLFEDSGQLPELVDGVSTKANVENVFVEIAQKVQSTDRFVLFMIGHATKAGLGLKFNLPGRDFSDLDVADGINQISAEQMILILGFPYSARMVPQISKGGRTIIVSCSSHEGYMPSGFGNIFIDAFSDETSDTDGNRAISLLEAFLYTQHRVKMWYEKDGAIQSEHPHLDDNGDGIPPHKNYCTGEERLLAQQTFFGNRRSPLMIPAASHDFGAFSADFDGTRSMARAEALDERDEEIISEITIQSLDKPATVTPPSHLPPIPYNFISIADEQQIGKLVSDSAATEGYPDANAVVLWEIEVLDINEDVSSVYSTRRVVKILNEGGHKFGGVSIPYTRGNDEITLHHARTIASNGEVFELDKRKIIKDIPPPSAVERGLFVDARLMHFKMPEMSDNCIIDYAYSSKNRGHIMHGEFWRQVYFQTSAPVQYYRFAVHMPKKKTLYFQVNGPQIEPIITESNYTRTYTFEVRDVPPLRREAFMPAIEDLAYNISISSINSWEMLVEWYATLIREQDYITPEIEEKTKALLKGAWTRRDKIKRLYEFVAANINYVGIELGIWAIKPHPAPLILKEKHGDCKDKTTLLSTMLAATGIRSYPVLICAGDSRSVVREIPSLAYFNHMILAVEDNDAADFIWLDSTVETCSFRDFPASNQDRWALIINPDFLVDRMSAQSRSHAIKSSFKGKKGEHATSEWMTNRLFRFAMSPTSPAEQNLKRTVTQIHVQNDLSVQSVQEITVTGDFNTKLRSELRNLRPDERSKFLQKYLELDNRATLDSYEVTDLGMQGERLKISLKWRCSDYLFAIGRQFVLKLPVVKHPYESLLSEQSRTYPVILGRTLTLEDDITVSLASQFVGDSVPENRELHNSVGSVQINYSKSKRKLSMKQILRLQHPRVEVNQVPALKGLLRHASNKGTKHMVLVQP